MTKTGKTYYPHQQEIIDALMKMDGKSVMAFEMGMGQGRHLGKTIRVAPRTSTDGGPTHTSLTMMDAPKAVARELDAVAQDRRIFAPRTEAHPFPHRDTIGGARLQVYAATSKSGMDIDDPADDDLATLGI